MDICRILHLHRPYMLNQLSLALILKLIGFRRVKDVREDQSIWHPVCCRRCGTRCGALACSRRSHPSTAGHRRSQEGPGPVGLLENRTRRSPATLSGAISFVVGASVGTSKSGRRASSKVLRCKIDCALLSEDTHGEGSVAVDFGLIVRKGLMVELEERLRQWRDRSFCPIDHLSERSNRRRPLLSILSFPKDRVLVYAI